MKLTYIKKPVLYYIIVSIILVTIILLIVDFSMRNDEDISWIKLKDNDRIESKYDLVLDFDPDNKTLEGTLEFEYYNDEDIDMNALVFFLYANSFEKEEYHAIEESDFSRGYPNGFSKGSIDIQSVEVQGGGAFEVTGEQNHLLIVNLDTPVSPKKRIKLKINYIVTIPNCLGRFGYGENTISLVNCNPILAPYDNGFTDYIYYPIGDPFYSECADYTAQIKIPKEYTLATSGHIQQLDESASDKLYVIKADDMRDFGFVVSDNFNVIEQEINGVTVRSYSHAPESVNKIALQAGVEAIDIFSRMYGEYPYDDFAIVETDFYIGGMEYPGMVLIDTTYYNYLYSGTMEMIIAHEAAHQWWYAQVGNDQVREPWLDESLTEFSTRVYYEQRYGDDAPDMLYTYVDKGYAHLNTYVPEQESRINLSTTSYGDSLLYSLVVYGQGSQLFVKLRQELGDEIFYKSMQKYLADNRFEIAKREDLEDAIESVSGYDITGWFEKNLYVKVGE